jgi:hypothetical protein
MATIMQPFHCDLQPQIPKRPKPTHAQTHPKQLGAYTAAKKKRQNDPSPQPPRTRVALHRRLQRLYTEKHNVSRSGILPNTSPMQHSCSHYNAN